MSDTQDSRTVTLASSEQAADTPMMGCRACGAMQPAGFRFCRVCGAPFTRGDLPKGFMDPLVGAVVGDRYRILGRIGAGGMGAVYRVEHVQIGKVAAMKLLHGELSRDQQMVRRFNREARAVSKLSSPHTVSVFDYGRSAGLVYIVMELLSGRDLAKVLRDEKRIAPARVAAIVCQVAGSLREAHALGIIHRDLKPQNIFLLEDKRGGDGDERIKVLDFGLAKLAEAREESQSLDETQAGVVMGTPHYMSPEQIRDRDIDHRADIYSLGAVVYRLLTGEPPFQHKTPLGVLHMHLNEPVPSLAATDPNLAAIDRVIRTAMAKRPDERYDSVTDFAEDLAIRCNTAADSGERGRIRITSDPESVDPRRIGTRHEFEVFERRLRLRRAFAVFSTGLAALGIAFGIYVAATGDLLPQRASESEPNDDLSSATPIRPGVLVAATASPRAGQVVDTDAFRVTRDDPANVLAVEATPAGGTDLALEVVGSSGQVLVRSDSTGPGGAEMVPNLPIQGDEVYLLVHGSGDAEPEYTLTARFREPYDDEESEPNGSAPQEMGALVLGAIGWAGDVDSYWLPGGRSGGRYAVGLAGAANLDLAFEVTDLQGTEVTRVDEHGPGRGEAREVEVDPARFVGRPIVRVSAGAGERSHLVYRLSVRALGAAGSDEEPPG